MAHTCMSQEQVRNQQGLGCLLLCVRTHPTLCVCGHVCACGVCGSAWGHCFQQQPTQRRLSSGEHLVQQVVGAGGRVLRHVGPVAGAACGPALACGHVAPLWVSHPCVGLTRMG
jgi:hypothetical protein